MKDIICSTKGVVHQYHGKKKLTGICGKIGVDFNGKGGDKCHAEAGSCPNQQPTTKQDEEQ